MKSARDTSPEQELRRVALLDTSKRAASGLYVYFALWIAISFVSGLYREHPAWVVINAGIMFANAGLRTLLHLRLKPLLKIRFRFAHDAFIGLTLLNALHWGVLTAISIYYPSLRANEIPMLLSATGIAAAGTNTYAINSTIRYLFPTAILVPVAVPLLRDATPEHGLIAVLVCIFVPYIVWASRVVHTDYWNALTNRRLLEERAAELQELSITDSLTRLRNRLFFDVHFEIEWRRAFRHHLPVAILLIDLDHFKSVNDSYGHALGDLCLQRAASAIRPEISRSGDILARYGGEEFIVLLTNTTRAGALTVAQRLLEAVRAVELPHGEDRISVTCSIGLAVAIPATQEQGCRLINDADKALYEAKQGGRNRVVVFDDVSPEKTAGSGLITAGVPSARPRNIPSDASPRFS